MMSAMLMAAQSIPTAPPPLPPAGPVLPQTLIVTSRCDPSDGDIVICDKKDPDQYRLRPLGPNGRPLPPMTAKLGDGTVDLKATQRSLPGASAPAVMATIKLPF